MVNAPYLPEDPLERFTAIYAALNAERSWRESASPLRFAALTAVTCPGEAHEVAEAIRDMAAAVKERAGWFGQLNSPLRFILSAMLVQRGDDAGAFLAEVERVREMFREAGLRRGGIYETMAIWVLRTDADLGPVTVETVERMRALYEVMKGYHWWLTGPDDFPACAILVGQEGTPEAIGAAIEQIYRALHDLGSSRGNPLQSAANLLYLSRLEPREAARRFHALADGFRAADVAIWQSDYDEVAILAFLDHPTGRIVERVLDRRRHMAALRPKPDRSLTFNLAASIAFIELVRCDRELKQISDAKALLDMQAILNAQQAAACAAATSAAVAASSASH